MRFGVVKLTNLALRVGAGGIEITQRRRPQPMRDSEIGDHSLGGPLRLAVRVDRRFDSFLGDQNADRDAVSGGGAGEDQAFNPVIAYCLEQRKRAHDIVAVIFARISDRFSDINKCREMHHGNRLVTLDRRVELSSVGDVADFERGPFHRPLMTMKEVVIDHREETARGQSLAGMRPDIAGTAGDEDRAYAHSGGLAGGQRGSQRLS